MTFYSKPAAHHLVFWILLPVLCLSLLILFEEAAWDLGNIVVINSYLFLSFYAIMLQYQSYEVKNGRFRIIFFAYFTNFSADMDKLISVKYRENGWFKRFFGMPRKTIELYFERDGHIELWNSDPEVFEYFQESLARKGAASELA